MAGYPPQHYAAAAAPAPHYAPYHMHAGSVPSHHYASGSAPYPPYQPPPNSGAVQQQQQQQQQQLVANGIAEQQRYEAQLAAAHPSGGFGPGPLGHGPAASSQSIHAHHHQQQQQQQQQPQSQHQLQHPANYAPSHPRDYAAQPHQAAPRRGGGGGGGGAGGAGGAGAAGTGAYAPTHPASLPPQAPPLGPHPGQGAAPGYKRSTAKDRDQASTSARGGATVAKKRTNDKQAAGPSAQAQASAKAAAAAEKAAQAALDEPLQESKKVKKRKEVVDRIHRVHWDTMENRDILYNDMQHVFAHNSSVLLLSPSLSRSYLLALTRLTLERDAQLRQSALLHAHQVESARSAYEQERQKVEDEAKSAKKAVRERLLAAVHERRTRLREEKEGGEGSLADTFLDASNRPHATRKLRNKGTAASSRRGGGGGGGVGGGAAGGSGGDAGNEQDAAGPISMAARAGITHRDSPGSSLGLMLAGASSADGTTTPNSRGGGADAGQSNGLAGSLAELSGFAFGAGPSAGIASLPPSNFDIAGPGAGMLHLAGVGGGMGDSSYMSGLRGQLMHQQNKNKKKAAKTSAAAAAAAAAAAVNTATGSGADGDGGDDDGTSRAAASAAASAAAAAAAAAVTSGAGRLRWDQGKSVGQLTSARDFEIEADLINIRKSGSKRRRR